MTTKWINQLEHRYTTTILLHLHENAGEPINKTDIMRMSRTGVKTRGIRLDQMVEAGLVHKVPDPDSVGNLYSLTPRGAYLASALGAIELSLTDPAFDIASDGEGEE